MCKVSVVMSVYNGEKYIRETIESVLSQTFTDFEFIILDNGSSDKSSDIINSYKDDRIKFIQNEKNLGLAESLNKGLMISQGEYIARIDADDVCYPDRFEKQVRYLDIYQDICLCSGRYTTLIGTKDIKTRVSEGLNPSQMRFIQFFINQVSHSTVMMRKDMLNKYNLNYNVDYPGAQDYGLWMEMIRYKEIVILKDNLIKYRIHDTNYSKNIKMMKDDVCRIQEKAFRFINLPENKKSLLNKANHGALISYDEITELGELLIKYYLQCGLELDDVVSRNLLETAYYSFLMNYFYLGYRVFLYAVKSGVFRICSIWRVKALVKSVLRKGYRKVLL